MLILQVKKIILFLVILNDIALPLFAAGNMSAFANEENEIYEENAQKDLYDAIQQFRNKEYEKALLQFEKIIQTYPQSSVIGDAWSYIGEIYALQKNYPKAIEVYSKFLEKKPNELKYYFKIFNLYDAADDPEGMNDILKRAKPIIEKTEVLKKEDGETIFKIAEKLEYRTQYKQAVDLYLILADKYSPQIEPLIFIESLFKAGYLAKSILKDDGLFQKIQDKITASDFTDPEYSKEAAERWELLGLFTQARSCYQKILKFNSDYYSLPDPKFLWVFPLIFTSERVSPVLADLNGDNQLEVIACSDEVFCLQGKDGEVIWHYPTSGFVYKAPLLADFDGDSMLDVVADSGDFVWALRGYDGKLLWKFFKGKGDGASRGHPTSSHPIGTSLFLGNFNGDDVPDVIVEVVISDLYCIDGKEGKVIWLSSLEQVLRPIAVGDINRDGIDDIVIDYEEPYKIRVLDGKNGKSIYQWKLDGVKNEITFNADVLDIDADNVLDIVVSTKGKLWALSVKKDKLWVTDLYDISQYIQFGSPFFKMVDLNGDSKKEIVVVSGIDDGKIFILDASTGTIQSTSLLNKDFHDAAFFDYDEDNHLDLVGVSGKGGHLLILSLKDAGFIVDDIGHKERGVYIGGRSSFPVIGDIDGDSKAEIVAGGLIFLSAFRTNKSCERNAVIWPRRN